MLNKIQSYTLILSMLCFASFAIAQPRTYLQTKCTDEGRIEVEYSIVNNAIVCCYDQVTGQKLSTCPEFYDCNTKASNCKRYIPIYFLFDNTGTNASNENTFLLEFADGSNVSIVQPPQTNSGGVSKWTNQFNVLEQLITTEYEKKCGAFQVETRFNPPPFNSTDLSGYTPPDGLLTPPSELWGTVPDMKYRYMQINSCSTCSNASIVGVTLIAVNGNPTELAMTSVFKVGKEVRYDICEECVFDGIDRMYWYQQTNTLVPESDLPVCLLECNESTPSPPESGCIFTTEIVCDNRGTTDLNDDVTITIRYQDCGDGELNIAYFIEDDGGLILYEDLIDPSHVVVCGSNSQVEPPEPTINCISIEETPICVNGEVSGVRTTTILNDGSKLISYDTSGVNTIQEPLDWTFGECGIDTSYVYFDPALCDSIICEIVTQPNQTEFLPSAIELNTWATEYNGGTIDEDNPLLVGETYTPSVNQNLHALFNLQLPECAVINEAYVLYDHEGASGTVYRAINTGTGAFVPNSFNAGVTTNIWAWHRGNSNSCANFGGQYTQIESLSEPCGTTRPIRYVSRMDLTPSVDDLNNLSITSVYANANVDIFHSIRLVVDYDLPNGCELEGEAGEGIVKVLNTQIIAQKAPLEVFGQLEVVQPCENQAITSTACLGADLPNYSLAAGDAVLFIGQVDCEGNTLGGSYYTLDGQTPIEEEVIIDPNCVPPSLQELQNCVADAQGQTYTQIIVVATDGEVLSEIYINTMTLETTNDIGANFPCPPVSDSFTKNKTCAIVDGQEYTGYEITYISAGNVISYFESLDGVQFNTYTEFCCDDCTQISDCFGGRGARFDFFVTDGQQVAVQDLVVDGVPNSPNDLIATVNLLYGGTGFSGVSLASCGNADLNNINLANVDADITAIISNSGTILNVGKYGNCTKQASVIACPQPDILDCQNRFEDRIPTQVTGQSYTITLVSSCGTFTQSFTINSEADLESQVTTWIETNLGGTWNVDFTFFGSSVRQVSISTNSSPCRLDEITFSTGASSETFTVANRCSDVEQNDLYASFTLEKNSQAILDALTSLNERKVVSVDRCCTYGVTPIDVWVTDYSDGTYEITDISSNLPIQTPDLSLLNCCVSGGGSTEPIKTFTQVNRSWISATVGAGGGFIGSQNGISTAISAVLSPGTGNNGVGREYTITFPPHPNGLNYQVSATPFGNLGGAVPNGLIIHTIAKGANFITFGLKSGDDGQGVDENDPFPFDFSINMQPVSVLQDVTF